MLSIPSATYIVDSGRGSLEYTSGELQADSSRKTITVIHAVFFMFMNLYPTCIIVTRVDKQILYSTEAVRSEASAAESWSIFFAVPCALLTFQLGRSQGQQTCSHF